MRSEIAGRGKMLGESAAAKKHVGNPAMTRLTVDTRPTLTSPIQHNPDINGSIRKC